MKKFLLLLLMAVPYFAEAQSNDGYLIKGQAVDSLTSEVISYVTCSVLSTTDSKQFITSFVSDDQGQFIGKLKSPGNYILKIAYVGKQTKLVGFRLDTNNKQVDLGKVLMRDNKLLKEVSVVATRQLIKADPDKITYDAQQDPESKTSNVLELMRKVPMVTVDGQDNVQLKGTSNFKYYLNGKPTNMFNNNAGTILKSMPANMVKKIEVISSPGAKYDAEGVGGIINIVTVQQASAEGFSATMNGQVSSLGSYGGGVNLMAQKGKFSFSGNFNFNYNKQFPITTTSDRTSYVTDAPYYYASQVATVKNPTPMQFGSGQLTYELDTLNLFTLSLNRSYGKPKTETAAETNDFDSSMNKVFSYNQESEQHQNWGSTDIGLDYQHTMHKKGENLTLSYKLSNTPNNSDYESTNTINSSYITTPQYGLAQWNRSKNTASGNEHTFQADYTNPIAAGHTLEMGAKYIIRINKSNSDEEYKYFDVSQSYPYTPLIPYDTVTYYKNNQDILGTYVSYTGKTGKWGWNGGLRYEYTWLDSKFMEEDMNFKTNYEVLVPSAFLTYQVTPTTSYKLGYNMRIQRPSISYLNPFVNRTDPNYISYGNPNLNPEKSHNVSFSFNQFTPKYNVSTELTYTFTNNAIEQYSFIEDGSAIQQITYANIGHNKQVNLNVFGSYRGLKWLNLYTNSSIGYVKMKSSSYGMSNDGFTGRFYLGGTFTLSPTLKLSTGGGGSLPQVNLQGKQSSFFFSYAALSKDLLKGRMTVSAVGIFLPKSHIYIDTKGYDNTTHLTTFTQKTDVHLTKMTEFRFNISYRIGSLNVKTNKAKATITNNDEKEKGNSSLGSSPM